MCVRFFKYEGNLICGYSSHYLVKVERQKLGQNSQYQALDHTIERVHDKVIVWVCAIHWGQVRWASSFDPFGGYVCKIIHPWDSFDYGFLLSHFWYLPQKNMNNTASFGTIMRRKSEPS